MTSSKRLIASVVLAAVLVAPAAWAANPSAEDFATARVLYKEGKDLRAAGDLKGALEKLKAAHALGRTPLTGIELARTMVQLGLLVEARETCLEIARLAVERDETARSAEARKDAATLADELRPRIASLRVRVTPAAAIVTIDGASVPAIALTEGRKVNPGHHVITAHVEGGATVSATTDLSEGQTGEVELAAPPAPVVVAPKEPLPHEPEPRETKGSGGLGGLIIAGISVTAAGLVVGAVGGLVAVASQGSLQGDCPNFQCTPKYFDELNGAKAAALASTIGFSVAGAGLVLLVVGLVTHTSPKESLHGVRVLPDLGFDRIGVRGAF